MQIELIRNRIIEMRGHRIMLDFDLAELYAVSTKVLKQAVRRNLNRFPDDFMFELNKEEMDSLRSQNVTSKRGGTRYASFAFTEQGVAMLASVLKSDKAIETNIAIVRAFVSLRQHLGDYKHVQEKLSQLEKDMNMKFNDVYEVLNYLIEKEKQQEEIGERSKIGFNQKSENKK